MEGATSGTVSVPEDGLRTMLRFVGEELHRQDMGRRSYREQGGPSNGRHIAAMTMRFRILRGWWSEACRAVGMSDDLRAY